jgi:hypothetical protein
MSTIVIEDSKPTKFTLSQQCAEQKDADIEQPNFTIPNNTKLQRLKSSINGISR